MSPPCRSRAWSCWSARRRRASRTWAAEQFAPDEIVSSDRLRAVVGHGEDDLDATDDAFALLDTIVEHRLVRGLTTVVDTLGLDDERRRGLPRAGRGPRPAVRGGGVRRRRRDVPGPQPGRGRAPARPRPSSSSSTGGPSVRDRLDDEGFDLVLRPGPVRHVAPHLRSSAPLVARAARADRSACGSGCTSRPSRGTTSPRASRATAEAAERAGFDSVWVMDHVRQIPQVGRDWDPMLESGTALAWLAAHTSRVRIGALVSDVSLRPSPCWARCSPPSTCSRAAGRVCGLGLGWYEREHDGLRHRLPAGRRALRAARGCAGRLPRLWGPGSKPFEGRALRMPDTICYPRPAAGAHPDPGRRRRASGARCAWPPRHADAVNVMGPVDVVRHKVDVLRRHCEDAGRDPAEVAVTHLAPTLRRRPTGPSCATWSTACVRPRLDPAAFAARDQRRHRRRPDRSAPRAGRRRRRRGDRQPARPRPRPRHRGRQPSRWRGRPLRRR